MSRTLALNLGAWRDMTATEGGGFLRLPTNHLLTHTVIVGMTGSGKSGLVTVLAEESLRAGVPTIVIDVKGDLPNLLLTLQNFDPRLMAPWVEGAGEVDADSNVALATERSDTRQKALAVAGIGEAELQKFCDTTSIRVITPGATAGESLHVLSALERRSSRWDTDPESARSALSAAISLVLRLLGRDPDPAKSKEHVLLRGEAGRVQSGDGRGFVARLQRSAARVRWLP